ncbi:hypothetical protein QFC22_006072 [Naganishia vaughanmartiniae]|uniref:Uncharacterized protein n=1 Tax=Naganishia vaughanmartiniae TaxID=1424756 RepID=A0ACC2WP45_9TREE|nr:hypothetical protein QFC22_006072 [Naganishia vaughanmartiniae]
MSLPSADKLQSFVLKTLDSQGSVANSSDLTFTLENGQTVTFTEGETQTLLKGVLDSLASRDMITYEIHTTFDHTLSPEGLQIAAKGSHEALVWAALPLKGQGEPMGIPELKEVVGDETTKVGQGKAFKNKWITKEGSGFVKAVESIQDTTRAELEEVAKTGTHSSGEKLLAELRKRKLIVQRKHIHYSIEKGPEFALEVKKLETDLTTDMLNSGAWKNMSYKKYNFNAAGAPPEGGALHPLLKVREEFRSIFFDMGFTEMPTNKFVESAFWNFDAMFVPQQHPAREMQDTFYLKEPQVSQPPPQEYFERVKKVHEVGGYGSIGYRAPFSEEESKKLLLRTHTTAVSADMLYRIANQEGGFKPVKMFSIDRVFRNETPDATHLAEFHQVEGVIADYDITLGHLIAILEVFMKKAGLGNNLRFKPAYNPYTEPSAEVFSYHEGLGKWIEVGNSGMFRTEFVQVAGIPEGVRVLGFGLSLERPFLLRYAMNDIRQLVGHKSDINFIRNAPAVRMDRA